MELSPPYVLVADYKALSAAEEEQGSKNKTAKQEEKATKAVWSDLLTKVRTYFEQQNG